MIAAQISEGLLRGEFLLLLVAASLIPTVALVTILFLVSRMQSSTRETLAGIRAALDTMMALSRLLGMELAAKELIDRKNIEHELEAIAEKPE